LNCFNEVFDFIQTDQCWFHSFALSVTLTARAFIPVCILFLSAISNFKLPLNLIWHKSNSKSVNKSISDQDKYEKFNDNKRDVLIHLREYQGFFQKMFVKNT